MGLSELSNGRRAHTMKRRKLSHSASPILSDSPPSLLTPPQLGTKAAVCASCHRAFSGAKQNLLVQCARCHAPTCTICSRTCNGCPPSVPPTPELTMSPATASPASPAVCSPDSPASLSFQNLNNHGLEAGSQRRPALVSHTNVTGTVGKRRKHRGHEYEDDVDRGCKGSGEAEDERMKETGILPGCGRIVCRGCSFETPESDLNTCYDCAGRSPFQT